MTATFTTTITGLTKAATQGILTDVVTAVNWMVVARDGNKFARKIGSTAIGAADPANFTPFQNLTSTQVLAWIPNPSTTDVQNALTAQIAAQVVPAVQTVAPPWATKSNASGASKA